MEMNLTKIDEGMTVLADINVKLTLKRIIRDNDFSITDDEIDYYVKNHKPSELQSELVFNYWAKHFGSVAHTKLVGRRNYIILLLILKKKLLLEAGHDNQGNFSETAKLPYILTGNLQDKVNTRIIRNAKFVNKVSESALYDKLKERQYKNLTKLKPEYILQVLSQIINTTFTYVVYEDDELLDKEIEYSEEKISDELLFFMNNM